MGPTKRGAKICHVMEPGRRQAKPETVRRLARAVGANEDYLLDAAVKSKYKRWWRSWNGWGMR